MIFRTLRKLFGGTISVYCPNSVHEESSKILLKNTTKTKMQNYNKLKKLNLKIIEINISDHVKLL